MHWGNYGWGMGFGWLFMVLFWVLVILCVVYVVRASMKSARGPDGQEAPLEILKKRYAKGEITREEFERMKDDLMKP